MRGKSQSQTNGTKNGVNLQGASGRLLRAIWPGVQHGLLAFLTMIGTTPLDNPKKRSVHPLTKAVSLLTKHVKIEVLVDRQWLGFRHSHCNKFSSFLWAIQNAIRLKVISLL